MIYIHIKLIIEINNLNTENKRELWIAFLSVSINKNQRAGTINPRSSFNFSLIFVNSASVLLHIF